MEPEKLLWMIFIAVAVGLITVIIIIQVIKSKRKYKNRLNKSFMEFFKEWE